MRKLIALSFFALSFMVAFASNGERDLVLENFNKLSVENATTAESQEALNQTAVYEIQIRIFICDGEGTGTDWFTTVTGPNGTGCIDENQLEQIKQMYLQMYSIYYPGACNLAAYETKLYDCIN